MRTIGGNSEEITALSPNNVIKQLIYVGICALVVAELLAYRFQHYAFHVRQDRSRVQTVYRDIAIAMLCERRLESFAGSIAFERIKICGNGRTVIVHIHIATIAFVVSFRKRWAGILGSLVGEKHFRVTDYYLLSLFSMQIFQTRHTGKVLSHVKDVSSADFLNGFCFQSYVVFDFHTHISLNLHVFIGSSQHIRVLPFGIVERNFLPTVNLTPCIIDNSVIKIIHKQRSVVRNLPVAVCNKALTAAVLVSYFQHSHCRRLKAILVAPTRSCPAPIAAEPSVAQFYGQRILSIGQHRGYIVGIIHYTVAEIGPTGSHIGIAGFLAVYIEVVEASCGGVKPCTLHLLGYINDITHHRRIYLLVKRPRVKLSVSFGVICLGIGSKKNVPLGIRH